MLTGIDSCPTRARLRILARRWPKVGVILGSLVCILMIAAATRAQPPPPALFFSDLDSGPRSGGEAVKGFSGAFVTLYGNFFGTSQGTSTVTWDGQNCLRVVPGTGSYSGWGTPYLWYQKIVVQIGSACKPSLGNFVVTVNGRPSNGIPFAVRTDGSIYCVSITGSDSNTGRFPNACWRHIPHATHKMSAGDVTYVENGVAQTTIDDFSAYLAIGSGGTSGHPISLIAYPGATSTLGMATGGPVAYAVIRSPNVPGSCPGNAPACYWNISGFKVRHNDIGIEFSFGSSFIRVTAMDVSCPYASGFFQGACMDTALRTTNIQYLGNYVHDNAQTGRGSTKGFHNMYFSTDSNHIVAAWNLIDGDTGRKLCNGGPCNACRGIQFNSSPQDASSGFDQYDLLVHDNVIRNVHCDGINFSTVDPSKGKVEAYNNLIYHVGTGTLTPLMDLSQYTCINFPGHHGNGPSPGGTAEVYDNTCFDFGSAGGPTAGAFGFTQSGTTMARFRNNIVYALKGERYLTPASTLAAILGERNVFFGNGKPPSPFSDSVNADPKFVSLQESNFHLQAGSPAIGSGANTGLFFDIEGVGRASRSAWDIGAYAFPESGSGALAKAAAKTSASLWRQCCAQSFRVLPEASSANPAFPFSRSQQP